jgi:hypothetical protein
LKIRIARPAETRRVSGVIENWDRRVYLTHWRSFPLSRAANGRKAGALRVKKNKTCGAGVCIVIMRHLLYHTTYEV